jgi:hypothetical protein
MTDDRKAADIDHYVRLAQNILDEGMMSGGVPLVDIHRERPQYSESELVERFLSDAARLAHSFAELVSWLEQSINLRGPRRAIGGYQRRRVRRGDEPTH